MLVELRFHDAAIAGVAVLAIADAADTALKAMELPFVTVI